MIRVTTLFASTAGVSARYYTGYLTRNGCELPGRWAGSQAPDLDLFGIVTPDDLEAVLSGLDPRSGTPLGRELLDRIDQRGNVIRAVAGYDATFSAPKSVSVLWAITGDDGFAECHDRAVAAAIEVIEKYGSTTRIRSNGTRLFPETGGLTIGVFRQSTSRADDPQLHTHVVISSKVQTADGRWYALDGRVLKRQQRAFGYFYQSVLRAELTARYGVVFDDIVNGQAEIAGVPDELLQQFSKRAGDIAAEMDQRVAGFIDRSGREPTDREYSAMEREASGDTRSRKTGLGVDQLRTRWNREAALVGVDAATLLAAVADEARRHPIDARASSITVDDVLAALAEQRSTWNRLDVIRTICDLAGPQPGHDATTWAAMIERAADTVLDACTDLDPTGGVVRRRDNDGRALHIEPVAAQATSEYVLAQEERIMTWALEAQSDAPAPSSTIADGTLDAGQQRAASAVAGHDRLVLVVGPAGAGKTRMLAAAVDDLDRHGRNVIGVAPTAKAAHVLASDADVDADTIAKFLRDLEYPTPHAVWRDPGHGATVIVDEAGMVNTADLARLVEHAERSGWRLVLVGDPYQLQAVGRGGMFNELCESGRTVELDTLHRFEHPWEADASLLLRAGDPRSLDHYRAHDRIRAGTFDEHLETIAEAWRRSRDAGERLSITTSRNEDVETINRRLQETRIASGHIDPNTATQICDGVACVGEVVATRRNARRLRTSAGEGIRNREQWTVVDTHDAGEITVTRLGGRGTITRPADYVRTHVELAYATTENGAQGHNAHGSINLATTATTGRNLYVAMTRGHASNIALVVTESGELSEAMGILEAAIAIDRADIPATAHRRALAALRTPEPSRRIEIPQWFDTIRSEAELARQVAHERLERQTTERARRDEQVATARRERPAATAAHAPHREAVSTLREEMQQTEWKLRRAQSELRAAGPLGRRSARRTVDAASEAHSEAVAQLAFAEQRAEPTRLRLQQIDDVISDARRRDSVDRIFDRWTDPSAAATRASDLCTALDRWKHWADGYEIDRSRLVEAAVTLDDHRQTPGVAELASTLVRGERIELTAWRSLAPEGPSLGIEL